MHRLHTNLAPFSCGSTEFYHSLPSGPVLLGAVHGEWPTVKAGGIVGWPSTCTQIYTFGMLSVPARNGGKGAGSALARAVIERLELEANKAFPRPVPIRSFLLLGVPLD
jgi:hypothetical protein